MLTRSPAWRALQAHYASMRTAHLREMFDDDPRRADRYRLTCCGLTLDYSKNRIYGETLQLLGQLAEQQLVAKKRAAMFSGEKINLTENRAVLHTALRSPQSDLLLDGENIMPGIHAALEKMSAFVEAVRDGTHTGYTGKKIRTVVNIGIGGSDLGPKMVATALKSNAINQQDANTGSPRVEFVSNIDEAHFAEVASTLDAETTLFVIASKTFTTQETLLNAHTARRWFTEVTNGQGDVAQHFVAVSTALEETRKFGIDDSNVFGFWDWVGGRYSIWSSVGLSAALCIGMDKFRDLLVGAHAMDQHFCQAPFLENMPVLLALIGIWYNNFFDARQHLILPYDYALKKFPAYVQQLDMESNGKAVNTEGEFVDYATGPVVWGGLGCDSQHSFYQLLHQGTHFVPADFIVALNLADGDSRSPLAASFVAQTQALMQGKLQSEVAAELPPDSDPALLAHKNFHGNRPTNSILMETFNAQTLGALIALYEHKVFVQGVIWQINSFDQHGVELGKQLARKLEPAFDGTSDSYQSQLLFNDASTQSLVKLFRGD